MIRIVCVVVLLISSGINLSAQQDQGHLYVMLEESLADKIIDPEGKVNYGVFHKNFTHISLQNMSQRISVPFYKAKGSALQRVLYLILDPSADEEATLQDLNRHSGVVYAEQVPEVTFFDTTPYLPNDLGEDNYNGQWYLHQIDAPLAWTISKGSRSVKVAVVDQAIDINHPDLKEALWVNPGEIPDNGIDDDDNGYIDDIHGYDVSEDRPDPSPGRPNQFHGTHVAGLVSAKSDNGIGIASMGFDVSIIAVKTEPDSSSRAVQYQGVVYAANAGADIINCSWGGYSNSFTNRQIIEYAQEQGCLVVVSSGNDGRAVLPYPAGYEGVISVGATNRQDRMVNFSNYNENLSVSSPGFQILSTMPDSSYAALSGTSMATPIVSGLLGLMKSHYPEITNEELKECLVTTTDSVVIINERYRGKTGSGRVNAYKAMKCVDNKKKGITGIDRISDQHGLHIYPNPAKGLVYLYTDEKPGLNSHLHVTDISGRTMSMKKIHPVQLSIHNPLTLDVSNWAAGIYFLELIHESKRLRGKIVVD